MQASICERVRRENILAAVTSHYIQLVREVEENHYMNEQIPAGSGLRCQDGTVPLQFLPTTYSQMVMALARTAFTEGTDENPYISNINLIKNSINKEYWSGGVLQFNQNSLQLSPVVLMIHWSFSRKLEEYLQQLTGVV